MEVERVPGSQLLKVVEEKEKDGWRCCHPFDDINLIAGYTSIGFEIFDELDPDIVLIGLNYSIYLNFSQCFNLIKQN